MSNMATMIMEGSASIYGKAHLEHSYDHENGAGLIAMESAEALRDIFESEFYVPNTCTINAALEGASCVEESSQATIMEASIKGAFEKIRQFFVKLKEKVKDFLHNIKRYLTGIFGNDVKWVEKYENELKELSDKDLKGYKVKMYEYDTMKILDKADIEHTAQEIMSDVKNYINSSYQSTDGKDDVDESEIDEKLNDEYENFLKGALGDSNPDAIQKNAWSKMRSGATSEKDKIEVTVGKSQVSEYISVLKTSSKDLTAYDTMITKINNVYNKAINFVDDCEKKIKSTNEDDNGNKVMNRASIGLPETDEADHSTVTMSSKRSSNVAMLLRKCSSTLSKMQSANDAIYSASKSAFQERNSAYKKALVGAFTYARKNKGGK